MAPIATLDANEVGSYTEDGGTSNNAKVNANFAIVRRQIATFPISVVASATKDIRRRIPVGSTIVRAGLITDGKPAGGTAVLDVLNGASAVLAAQVDLTALTDDVESVPALHGTPANLVVGASGYVTARVAGGVGVSAGVETVLSLEYDLP